MKRGMVWTALLACLIAVWPAAAWDSVSALNPTHGIICKDAIARVLKMNIDPVLRKELALSEVQKALVGGANSEMHEGKPHGGNNWGSADIKGWFDDCLTQYRQGNLTGSSRPLPSGAYPRKSVEGAYYHLGTMLHMVSDLGVPAHASHIKHGILEAMHDDGLEWMATWNWRPDYANPDTDHEFNGTSNGDPGYANPWDYYHLSQVWTLYDIDHEPCVSGKTWAQDYWRRPTSPFDETDSNFGSYGSANWSLTWAFGDKAECRFLSLRQARSAAAARWALHSAVKVLAQQRRSLSNPNVTVRQSDGTANTVLLGDGFTALRFRLVVDQALSLQDVILTTQGTGTGNVQSLGLYVDSGNGAADNSDNLLGEGGVDSDGTVLVNLEHQSYQLTPGQPYDLLVYANTLPTGGIAKSITPVAGGLAGGGLLLGLLALLTTAGPRGSVRRPQWRLALALTAGLMLAFLSACGGSGSTPAGGGTFQAGIQRLSFTDAGGQVYQMDDLTAQGPVYNLVTSLPTATRSAR